MASSPMKSGAKSSTTAGAGEGMRQVDVLLIHVPRMRRDMNQIMVMPAGLFSMADVLDRAGISVEILHVGLARQKNPAFSLPKFVEASGAKVCAFTLHWFYQTFDVIQSINQLKSAMPGMAVVVGGYTASCLYRELILRRSIDFLVRGDGELPLKLLTNRLLGLEATEISAIPNLVWRDSELRPHANELSFQASAEFMSDVSHARMDLLVDSELYFSDRVLYKDFDERILANKGDFFKNAFFYTPGKGCPYNCSFCGGSHETQKGIFHRAKTWFFPDEKILNDFRAIWQNGINTIRLSFDPDPRRRAYLRLFEALRSEGIRFTLVFDCWTPPDEAFVEAVASTFTKESMLVISPDAGSEEVRRKNKSCYYSNDELMESLNHLSRFGVRGHVFFGLGLPFESAADLELTALLAEEVVRRGFNVSALPMDCDPCSMIQGNPDGYGVTLEGQGLRYYFEATRSDAPFVSYKGSLLSPEEIDLFLGRLIHRLNALVR